MIWIPHSTDQVGNKIDPGLTVVPTQPLSILKQPHALPLTATCRGGYGKASSRTRRRNYRQCPPRRPPRLFTRRISLGGSLSPEGMGEWLLLIHVQTAAPAVACQPTTAQALERREPRSYPHVGIHLRTGMGTVLRLHRRGLSQPQISHCCRPSGET